MPLDVQLASALNTALLALPCRSARTGVVLSKKSWQNSVGRLESLGFTSTSFGLPAVLASRSLHTVKPNEQQLLTNSSLYPHIVLQSCCIYIKLSFANRHSEITFGLSYILLYHDLRTYTSILPSPTSTLRASSSRVQRTE
jgi:hypothetical protein